MEKFDLIVIGGGPAGYTAAIRGVGEHSSATIQVVGLLIQMNSTIEVLSELVHSHPSIV